MYFDTDLNAQHQQLPMNPRCAPQRIVLAHPPDQVRHSPINPWPPCPLSRVPPPKETETSPVPAQDSLRLNHTDHIEQAWLQPDHPDHDGAILMVQPNPHRCVPQCNAQLMPKKQNLGFKPRSRLEQVDEKHSRARKIADIVFYDATILPPHANPGRMEFSGSTTRSRIKQTKRLRRGSSRPTKRKPFGMRVPK